MTLPLTPTFRLDGKNALVTGAGRGIGRAGAAALAQAGAKVTLCARSLSEIEEVASEIIEAGGEASVLSADIIDVRAFAASLATLPAFDILLNNAGTNRPGPFLQASEEDFDAVMGLNVRAAFFAAQSVARQMVGTARRGSIINVSSALAHVANVDRSIYCASKFAVEGLTKAMALDLASHGIRVNTICPTFTETPMTVKMLSDPVIKSSVLSKIKLGRVGQVEDLMGGIVFLASDASSLMTGTSLLIDGGWTAD